MSAFRFVRRSRRPAAPSRVTVSRPQLVQLEGRDTPAGPVVLSPQAPFASALDFTPTFNATTVLPGKFTASGFVDYVAADPFSDALEVGINNADAVVTKTGTVLAPPTFTTVVVPIPNPATNGRRETFSPNVIAVGDFLGAAKTNAPDGIDEIAVLAEGDFFANTARVVILKSDGVGGFTQAASVAIAGRSGSLVSVAAGDLNADGAADLFVTRNDSLAGPGGSFPAEYTVLLNTKAGSFTTVQRSSNSSGFTELLRPQIADVDGDRNADVVAYDGGSFSAGTVVVLYGDGKNKGTFEAKPALLSLPTGQTANIAVGNFSNRINITTGRPLLSIAATSEDFNARNTLTVLNQSRLTPRTFPALQQQTITQVAGGGAGSFQALNSLGVGDFDFDGTDDLAIGDGAFVSSFGGASNRVYLFKGSDLGLTTPGTQYASSGSVAGFAVADFDGNKLVDVLAAQEASGATKLPEQYQLYLNLTRVGGEVTITSSSPVDPFTGSGQSSYTQPITLTVSVSKFIDPATGFVDFVASGPGGSRTLNANPLALVYDPLTKTSVATFTVAPPAAEFLDAGTYRIVANYTKGNYENASSVAISETVNPLDTDGTLTVSANPLVFGQPVTLAVSVKAVQPAFGPPATGTPVGGTVAFFDRGDLIGAATVDANGVAALTLPGLALGDHPIRAQFLATDNFNSSLAPPDKVSLVFTPDGQPVIDPFTGRQATTSTPQSVLVTVNRANSVTDVTAPAGTVTFGQPVTLTSKVSIAAPGQGAATGSVEFFRDGVSVGRAALGPGGVASLDVTNLPAGTFTFTSQFLGNDGVAPSNAGSSVSVTVVATESKVALTGPAANRLGGTATLTATVTNLDGQPVSVGTVTFTGTGPDGRPIALGGPVAVVNGAATLDVTGLALGTSTFNASFSGAPPSIGGGTAPQTVAVVTGRATPGFALTNDAGGVSVPLGKDVTYTATFTAPTGLSTPPTGTVTFRDGDAVIGSAPLVNGVARFTTRLGGGPHTISAVYGGDATYLPGQFDTSINVFEPARGFLVASGAGGSDVITQYNPDGSVNRQVFAFGPDSTSGVRVAYADFTGDGVPDVVAGTGPGTPARVRILDGATLAPVFEAFPFDNFAGGLFVAVGDVNGDNRPELVVSPDVGGGPRVTVFDGAGFAVIANYFGITDPDFRGGARVAVGDVNNDGVSEVIVSAGIGGGPRITVWDGRTVAGTQQVKLFGDFFAFEPELRNGAYVAAGDINSDGFADIVFGAGPGGGPRVVAMSGRELTTTGGANRSFIANFFGGDVDARGGVPVNTVVRSVNGPADILVGSAEGGNAISVYAGGSFAFNLAPAPALTFGVFEDGSNPLGGVFVG